MQQSSEPELLEEIAETLQRRWGGGALFRGNRLVRDQHVPLDTGHAALDRWLAGGVAPGLSLWEGRASCGAHTLALQLLARHQGRLELPLLLDPGHTFDPGHAARCGVAVGQLVLVRPQTPAEGWALLEDLLVHLAPPLLLVYDGAPLLAMAGAERALRRIQHRLTGGRSALLFLASLDRPARPYSLPAQLVLHLALRGTPHFGQWGDQLAGYTVQVTRLVGGRGTGTLSLTLAL